MWKIFGSLLVFLWSVNLPTATLAAEPTPFNPSKRFDYDLELSLLMIDALKPPPIGPSAVLAPPTSDDSGQKRGRGLGLERAKFNGKWSFSPTAILELGLRPDALTRRSDLDSPPATREFDTRAGGDIPQKPRIALLDTYDLHVKRGESFSAYVGVFSDLVKRRISYPEILEFGLVAPFPSKFSGVRLALDHPQPTEARVGPRRRFIAEATLYQGDEDRAELLDVSANKTSDHGTIVNDPYQGASGYFGWMIDDQLEIGALLGGGDTSIQDGRRNDFLFQFVTVFTNETVSHPYRMQFEGRVKREKWNVPIAPRVPLEHRSFSLTSAVSIISQVSALVGVHQGATQKHSAADATQTNSTNGNQMDAGLLYDFSDGLQLTALLAQERREFADDDGSKSGAFGTRADPTLVIRRFAFELNYVFHDGGSNR